MVTPVSGALGMIQSEQAPTEDNHKKDSDSDDQESSEHKVKAADLQQG